MHFILTVLGGLLVAILAGFAYLTLAVNAEAAHQDRVLSVPPVATDREGFLRAVQGATGQPLSTGNEVVVMQNGDAIFPAMLESIRGARSTVHLATYIYWDGEVPRAFGAALSDAARRGVVVRIVLDSEGAELIPHELVQGMRDAGCTVTWFRRARWYDWTKYNRRSHRRVLIVDGVVAFTGGVGIADEWSGNAQGPKHWRETHARVTGPVVAALQAAFADNWNQSTRELLLAGRDYPPLASTGDTPVCAIVSTPANGASAAQRAYAACIATSTGTLHITNAYFVPTPAFVDALCAARGRGVDVKIIVPGPYHDQPIVRRASRHTWPKLLASGVEIYEYQPTMIHAKTFVVDGVLHLIGSINFDPRSFALNSECGILIVGAKFAAAAEGVFAADLARSRRIEPREVEERGFVTRSVDKIWYWCRAQL